MPRSGESTDALLAGAAVLEDGGAEIGQFEEKLVPVFLQQDVLGRKVAVDDAVVLVQVDQPVQQLEGHQLQEFLVPREDPRRNHLAEVALVHVLHQVEVVLLFLVDHVEKHDVQRLPRVRQDAPHHLELLSRALVALGTLLQRVHFQVALDAEDPSEGASAAEGLFVVLRAELLDDVLEASS